VRRSRCHKQAERAGAVTGLTGVFINVSGFGTVDPVDPVGAWHTVTRPKPVLEPQNIFDACDMAIGRLDGLIAKAYAEAPPTLGVATMHPLVWNAAKRLWRDGDYREAVASAAAALVAQVKIMTGRNDVVETDLWRQTFSADPPAPDKPRLRWPGEPSDRNVKSMNDGLRPFAPGVQLTIRNLATHVLSDLGEQEATEQLATSACSLAGLTSASCWTAHLPKRSCWQGA